MSKMKDYLLSLMDDVPPVVIDRVVNGVLAELDEGEIDWNGEDTDELWKNANGLDA